jgi:hypothetical protein
LALTANLACFLLPKSKKPLWTSWLPSLSIVIVVLHLLLEKYRWQMLPAYSLALLFFLLSPAGVKVGENAAKRTPVQKVFTIFGIIIGARVMPVAIALPALVPRLCPARTGRPVPSRHSLS